MVDGTNSLQVSHRVNVSGKTAPTGTSRLPDLPGSEPFRPGILDRIGEQVRSSAPLIGGAGLAGATAGAVAVRRGGGGVVAAALGGVLGGIGGAALGVLGLAGARGTDGHAAPKRRSTVPVASTDVVAREQLKVMTYNVHGGMGGPGKMGSSDAEIDALAAVIRRDKPDVLLLQEVDQFAGRSNRTDVLAELARKLDATSAVGGTDKTTILGRNQNSAVLTFNGTKIEDARNVVHPDRRGSGLGVRATAFLSNAREAVGRAIGEDWRATSRDTTRNTIETLVRTPSGTHVRVMSGHYQGPAPDVDHQARQVGALAGALDAWDGPTIWGADFNVRTASKKGASEHRIMANAGLRDAFDAVPSSKRLSTRERSSSPVSGFDPAGGIDRIYVSKHARVLGAHVDRSAGDASDHLPVVAEIELQPGTGS